MAQCLGGFLANAEVRNLVAKLGCDFLLIGLQHWSRSLLRVPAFTLGNLFTDPAPGMSQFND